VFILLRKKKNHHGGAAKSALMFLAEKEPRAAGLRETGDGSPICNLNYIKRACQFKLRAAALLVIHIRDSWKKYKLVTSPRRAACSTTLQKVE